MCHTCIQANNQLNIQLKRFTNSKNFCFHVYQQLFQYWLIQCLSYTGLQGARSLTQGHWGHKARDRMDRVDKVVTHCRAQSHTHLQSTDANHMCLDWWRKQENPEETLLKYRESRGRNQTPNFDMFHFLNHSSFLTSEVNMTPSS